jgi:PAS domain S-box-containing protein
METTPSVEVLLGQIDLLKKENAWLKQQINAINFPFTENEISSLKNNISYVDNKQEDISHFTDDNFAHFITQVPEGIILFDQNGIVKEWNPAIEEITGWKREQAINLPIWEIEAELLPPSKQTNEHKSRIKNNILFFLAQSSNIGNQVVEQEIYTKDNTTKILLSSVFVLNTPTSWHVCRIIHNQTNRILAEKQLEAYKNRLEKMIQVRTNDLKRSRELLYSVLANTSDIIWIVNEEMSVMFESPSTSHILGFPNGYFNHKQGLDYIHADDIPEVSRMFDLLKKKGSSIPLTEFRLKKADGHYLYVDAIGANFLDNLWIEGIVLSIRVAEDRKRAEDELRKNEEKFHAIFDQSFQIIALLDVKGNLLQVNNAFVECTGLGQYELIGQNFSKTKCWSHNETEQNKLINAIDLALKGETSRFETFKTDSNGKTHYFDYSLKPVFNNKTEITLLIAEGHDITKQKDNERKEKEHNAFLHTLIETIPLPVYYKDTKGNYIGCNTSFEKFVGFSRKDLIGKNLSFLSLLLSPKEDIDAKEQALLNSDTFHETEYKIDTSEGVKNIILHKKTFKDAEGNIAGLIGAIFDITDIRKAQEKVIESEKIFRNIFSASTDTIILADKNLKILEINDVFFHETGYTKDMLSMGTGTAWDIITPKHIPALKKMLERLFKDGIVYYFESEIAKPDRSFMPVELNCKMIEYQGQSVVLTIARDITERRKSEKILIDAIIDTEEKERERLAGDLHDEIGPLLSSMKMYINSLAETTDPKKQEYLIEQINLLVKEALQTVREISNDLSPHILNHYGLIAALNNFFNTKQNLIQIDFNANFDKVRFNSNLEIIYYRIIKELFNNTIKHAKATLVSINITFAKNTLTLNYSDNGCGFDIESIFENQNEKKGIGLLNILSRLRSIKGKYEINTAPGNGFSTNITAGATKLS